MCASSDSGGSRQFGRFIRVPADSPASPFGGRSLVTGRRVSGGFRDPRGWSDLGALRGWGGGKDGSGDSSACQSCVTSTCVGKRPFGDVERREGGGEGQTRALGRGATRASGEWGQPGLEGGKRGSGEGGDQGFWAGGQPGLLGSGGNQGFGEGCKQGSTAPRTQRETKLTRTIKARQKQGTLGRAKGTSALGPDPSPQYCHCHHLAGAGRTYQRRSALDSHCCRLRPPQERLELVEEVVEPLVEPRHARDASPLSLSDPILLSHLMGDVSPHSLHRDMLWKSALWNSPPWSSLV